MDAKQIRKIKAVYRYSRKYMQEHTAHPYHCFNHAADVTHAILRIASAEGSSQEEKFLLMTAALLHDLIYVIGGKENEEESARLAEHVLPQYGYTPSEVISVSKLILATKLPTKPNGMLEMIICDADLDYLGRPDFLEKGARLRQELGIPESKGWYERQLGFISRHNYYTSYSQMSRAQGLRENIELVKNIMEGCQC